jgi:hypothetical protein
MESWNTAWHPVNPNPSMSLLRKWLNVLPGRFMSHTSELEANVTFDIALTLIAIPLSKRLSPSTFSSRAISLVTDTGIKIAKFFTSILT